MVNYGKKLNEVFTIDASFDKGELDDSRTMIGYGSMDEAIRTAKELEKEYSKDKYYKHLEVSVCFNEFKYSSGDILGDRTCLSLRDLGIKKRK